MIARPPPGGSRNCRSVGCNAVYLVQLDPIVGSETARTRPCVVVSPDELNRPLRTAIVAPLTPGDRPYPWRVPTLFGGVAGRVALDQLRTVDRQRLLRRLGRLDAATSDELLRGLAALFAR